MEALDKIENEEIVQKINTISDLEKLDPYPNYLAQDDYWKRIERACRYIPHEYHFYALSLFANVIYIPSIILDEAWRQGLRELNRLYELTRENLLSKALVLGEDGDLVRRFCYANNLCGRLDLDKQPRTPRVGDLARDLLLSKCSISRELKDVLDKEILLFLKRNYWLLLVDNALSGISLRSEIEKILKLSEIANPDAKMILLVQVITSDALRAIEGIESKAQIEIIKAIYLDERFKINSEHCKLFKDRGTLKGVQDLCTWFADEILCKDEKYVPTKGISEDDLRYGFRASGLTLVTPNCPSNSVPLLWYYRPSVYEGPYPRVESRISQTKSLDRLFLKALCQFTEGGQC
jgi:hypothetical protein